MKKAYHCWIQSKNNLPERMKINWFVISCLLVIIFGAFIRLNKLGFTFFIDEIWAVDFVANRNYVPHEIPSPPIFFYLTKTLLYLKHATNTATFRQVAFMSGVMLTAVPLLAWPFLKPMVDRITIFIWTFLLAFSSPIIFYSARVKQYTTEALGSIIIICLFIYTSNELLDFKRWRLFFLASIFFVVALHSPIFVLSSTLVGFLFLIFSNFRHTVLEKSILFKRVVLGYLIVFVSFALAYLGYLKPGQAVTDYFGDLYQYFSTGNFAKEPLYWDGSLNFAFRKTVFWVGQMLNLTRGFLVLAAGAVTLFLFSSSKDYGRNARWALSLVCLFSAFVPLVASYLKVYPYGEVRLLIYAAPGLYLLVSLGLSCLIKHLMGGRLLKIGLLPIATLLLLFLHNGVVKDTYNSTYMNVQDLKLLYGFLIDNYKQGELIFSPDFYSSALVYYVPEVRGSIRERNGKLYDYVETNATSKFWVLGEKKDQLWHEIESKYEKDCILEYQNMRLVRYGPIRVVTNSREKL